MSLLNLLTWPAAGPGITDAEAMGAWIPQATAHPSMSEHLLGGKTP
jgi:hypothetical protein